MRQFLVRLLAFLVVILLILLRSVPADYGAALETQQIPLRGKPTKAPLVIADTGRPTQAPPYTLAALDVAQQAGADGFYLPVQRSCDGESGRPELNRPFTAHRTK